MVQTASRKFVIKARILSFLPPPGPCSLQKARNHTISFHMKEKSQFPCHLCDKTFSRQATLDIHLEVHENKKNYKCGLCESRFNNIANRNAHERSVHLGIKGKVANPQRKKLHNRGTMAMETFEERKARWLSGIQQNTSAL